MHSRRLIAALSLVAVAATGCTAVGGSTDKAGGSESVVLKMAITADSLNYTKPLAYFVHRVNELSSGDLRITPIYRWGNFAPNVEQLAVRGVKSGEVDLTSVGTRVFDTLGVNSFQALQAPMLVNSYSVQDAVIKSDVADQMLSGLDRIGVAGLGVYAAPLPKLIAVHQPLLGLKDWHGITFQTYLSRAGYQAITALGAHPVASLGSLNAGLQNGGIQGFAKSLLADQLNGTAHIAPYVTANVNLWSGVAVLIANPDRLSRLTAQQRDWLQQAAGDTTAHSTSMVDRDQPIVKKLCREGARFANASQSDLMALRRAFIPVYSSLEQSQQTKGFITRIMALKSSTAADPPLKIPVGCSGSAP